MARAKKVPNEGPVEHPGDDAPIPHEFVETAAYYRWENRGRPTGDDWYDWIEAERELKAWMQASGILPPKKKTR